MKPPSFVYYRPKTLENALKQLNDIPDAKVLAGGQSLIPMMNMRLAHPEALIDINQLASLSRIVDDDAHLTVGALVRHSELQQSPLVHRYCPVVVEAENLIAHPAIRTRGTVGGSLAHADPAAELPVLARLLDWDFVAQSVDGTRILPADEFFLSYFMTGLMPNELLTDIHIPKTASSKTHITEYTIRHGDFALAIVALSLDIDQSNCISDLRVALGGVADIPWRNRELEKTFLGALCNENTAIDLAQQIAHDIDPVDDLHASGDYRRHLTESLLRNLFVTSLSA